MTIQLDRHVDIAPQDGARCASSGPEHLPPLPGRTMTPAELEAWVAELAATPEAWAHLVRHDAPEGGRYYVSLHRDADVDVWLLCWNTDDDTGWHDHDSSSGAVAVTRGAVLEHRPRLGGEAETDRFEEGATLSFGPEHIHRMAGAIDGSVSIHAYSPPLWRMGQYSISASGTMRRHAVSYADELRPLDDPEG
ncbi:cysteine dioxygenase family protein [Nocardioides sp. TRM66260-LWL]|uniref:cysteine dioxygenase n=1 Tax=Nocardioides sp. TRM66260-LWL TaxID=2874478 RepID=UPI001CC392D5|nr:cysteine dioxygenase family protein [Nocardioides sp. TRM66260-LWL]MBZ5735760.1 cysteine dioxygenase family protein [Nocardioides sp. TRM66260-LWL]